MVAIGDNGPLQAWKRAGRRHAPPVLISIVVCVGVRALVLVTDVAGFDGDEAITALMAQRILDGEHFVYFAGQRYLGTFEQYLQAATFAVLPDTPFTSRLPMLGLAALTCALTYAIARAAALPRAAAGFAAMIFALGPLWNVLLTAKNRGAYSIGMVVGAAGLLLALRAATTPRPRLLAAALGLCCGLGFWNNWMAAYLLVPAALWWVATRHGPTLQRLAAAAGGFVVGALPALVEAVRNGWPTAGGVHPPSTVVERAGVVVSDALPVFLGLRAFGPLRLVPAGVETVVLIGVGAAFVALLVVHRRGVLDVLTLRAGYRRPIDLLVVCVAMGLVLAIVSPTSWFGDDPRYLSPLYVVVPVLLAIAVVTLLHRRGPRLAAGVSLLALTALATVAGAVSLHTNGGAGNAVDGTPVRHDDVVRVAEHLQDSGVRAAYGDFWIAQPLQFAVGDDVVVAPTGSDRLDARSRIPSDASPAWVVPAHQAARFHAEMREAGQTARRDDMGPWAVFTQITPPRHP